MILVEKKFVFYRAVILFAFFLCFAAERATSGELLNPYTSNNYTPSTGIKAAYMGSIIFPGFKIGIERPYKYIQKSKSTKVIFKERYFSYSLGMYHQRNYHTNYFLNTEWVSRRQKATGLYFEYSLGIGLSRTFVHGASYSVVDDGSITKVPLAGNFYALSSVGAGIGYNFNCKSTKPYSIYFKHQWMVLFPYNTFVTPRPTIELGMNFNVSGFWTSNPRVINK